MRIITWQRIGVVMAMLAMIGCAAIKTDRPLPDTKSATLITTNYHWTFPYLFADVDSWNLRVEQIDGQPLLTADPHELSPGVHTVIAYVEQGPKGPVGNVILGACRGEARFEAEAGHEYQMNFYKAKDVQQLQLKEFGTARIVSSVSCNPLNVWTRKESNAKF